MEKCDVAIFHAGYSFLYNEDHEQASWVLPNICGIN
jgi:hypothetical protein